MRLRTKASLAVVFCAAILFAGGYYIKTELESRLPQLDGTVAAIISDDTLVERDNLGTVIISAKSWLDAAYALGFAHAQDRYFMMDVSKRSVTGELSELFGESTLDYDKSIRRHRFFQRANQYYAALSEQEKSLLETYAAGVNHGLNNLTKQPFEYVLLGIEPQSWRPQDSLLIIYSMYLSLQDNKGEREYRRYLAQQELPADVLAFLFPAGSQFDAALDETQLAELQVPELTLAIAEEKAKGGDADSPMGSNNWAVSGQLTEHGHALVADDMHLTIRAPNIWYRAQINLTHQDVQSQVTGVTLPGAPTMVVGSNRHIAWGFTNSYGDWYDLIKLELHPTDPNQYLTPYGYQEFAIYKEEIKVGAEQRHVIEVKETIWGPVIQQGPSDQLFAYRWVAHDVEGINIRLDQLKHVTSVREALDLAKTFGIPAQNFVVGDAQGNIGWTIAGPIPNRIGYDGQYPQSWADGSKLWDGYIAPADYPEIYNPESGRIWTANSRVVGGEHYKLIGDGGYDIGHRADQIKQNLFAKQRFSEQDFLDIQLDDRALYLTPWKVLAMRVIEQDLAAQADNLLQLINRWDNRATPDSKGYALLKLFRSKVAHKLVAKIDGAVQDDQFAYLQTNRQWSAVLLKIIHSANPSWLPKRYQSYDGLLAEALNEAYQAVASGEYQFTGKVQPQHVMANSIPVLGSFLKMPAHQVSGDILMPKISRPNYGASERMVVAPGREQHAIFHMPAGQSSNPLSPYWSAGHQDWILGNPSPFNPGKAQHRLLLTAEKQP